MGTSRGVIIPKAILDSIDAQLGDKIEVDVKGKCSRIITSNSTEWSKIVTLKYEVNIRLTYLNELHALITDEVIEVPYYSDVKEYINEELTKKYPTASFEVRSIKLL